jgi:hypothetical protein
MLARDLGRPRRCELFGNRAIGWSGIVRCVLARDTRRALGQTVRDREPRRPVDDKGVRVGAEAGVVVERGQRDAVERHGAGVGSGRCASVRQISRAPASRTPCKSRGACLASTRRRKQAPRRRESGNRRPRPAPALGMARHAPSGTAGNDNATIASRDRQSRSVPRRRGSCRAALSFRRPLGLVIKHVIGPRLIADHVVGIIGCLISGWTERADAGRYGGDRRVNLGVAEER